jgi:glycosyltransferase involved in cell wall biosynthesis
VTSVRVGFVGRIVEQKRPLLFVQAVAALRSRGVDAEGVVLGVGPLQEAMQQEAEGRGVPLTFRGWHQNWLLAADEIDCLLLSSSVEGLGNVLVEAASVGLPCVAWSGALGVADAMISGVTGGLALRDTASDYADALQEVAFRDFEPSDVDGWLQRFDADRSTSNLEAVLRAAIGARNVDFAARD